MYPAENGTPAGGRSARLRVLVVDDEPDTVMMLLAVLRSAGHDPRGHASGAAAVEALHEFDPDVVISDIAMPGVNGWALAREVRQKMGEKRPILIAISGRYTENAGKALSQTNGFDFFLTKPADPDALLALVEYVRTHS